MSTPLTRSATLSPLNHEYTRMLYSPVLIEGPHKIAIDALQKQIDLRFKEINELRSTQNSHVPVSRLPAELLSQVFLYIVESGLQPVDLGFAWGTFGFRRVCKRWNEVAVGFPHLWARWASSAFVVWGLFNARSKGVPISLTWRPSYDHIRHGDGVLADPTIPGRIRTFDCTGTQDRLEHLLGTFTSDHFPIASSIRLHVTPYDEHGPKENTAAFLSLPFPKLSRLDIKNSLPGSSSPIFTTSNLVSLKLGVPYIGETQHTRSQFSQILQRHSNLQELHLWQGGMPQVDPSEPPAPVILPQLVDLRLYGNAAIIAGFMVLLDMSSPLHNVVIDLEPTSTTTSGLTNAVKKILVLYYECQGLDFPRTADHLTVPSRPQKKTLVFNVESRPTSASDPTYSFELRLGGVDDTLGREICPLFPLDHVREFSVTGLSFSRSEWRGMFEKMEGLVHLQLDKVNLGPAMGALGSGDELKAESPGLPTPNLQSLTLRNLDIRPDPHQGLLGTLYDRRDEIALKSLVVRSCSVHDSKYEEWVKELAEMVTWEGVEVIDMSDEDSESESGYRSEYRSEYEFHLGGDLW